MRLHAYLVQALVPGKATPLQAQLPGFDSTASSSGKQDLATFVHDLKKNGDERAPEASKALDSWGTLEVVDIAFKGACNMHGSCYAHLEANVCVQVIGERLVTPSSIVFLLVKLRVKEPSTTTPSPVQDAKTMKKNEERDEKFLNKRGDAEEVEGNGAGYAHAPYWPGVRGHANS